MPSQKTKQPKSSQDSTAAILAEYKTLRDEILKRVEFRYQIINLILVVAGTFLTVGVQDKIPAAVLLVYPILALFLIASWAHNGMATLRIGRYLRESVETQVDSLHWETYMERHFPRYQPFGLLGFLSTTGLVLTTQALAIALALLKTQFAIIDIVLLACSGLSVVLTVILSSYISGLRR